MPLPFPDALEKLIGTLMYRFAARRAAEGLA
jgi:hypothetical protein